MFDCFKKRPMLCAAIVSTLVCIMCAMLTGTGIVVTAGVILLVSAFVIPIKFNLKPHIILSLVLSFVICISSLVNYKNDYQPAQIYSSRTVVADCTAISDYNLDKGELIARVNSVFDGKRDVKVDFKIRLYSKQEITFLPTTDFRAKINFYEIDTNRFDSDGVYLDGIAESIYVLSPVKCGTLSFKYYGFRQFIKSLINFNDAETTAFARAMLLGDKNELSGRFVQKFRALGMSHVMAVSGMHIMFAVMFLDVILNLFGVRIRKRSAIALISIVLFTVLTGFPASCVRSAIMLFIFFVGRMTELIPDTVTSLSIAVFLILAPAPYTVGNLSFILSVCAVLGILLITPVLNGIFHFSTGFRRLDTFLNSLKYTVTLSLGALIACLPVQMIVFREVSLIAPISNAILMLPIKIMFYLCFFAMIPFVGTVISFVVGLMYRVIEFAVDVLYALPFTTVGVYFEYFYLVFVLLLILLVCIYVYLIKFSERRVYPYFIGYAVLCVTLCIISAFSSGKARFIAADVGEGNCNIIQNGNSAVIVDCGGTDFSSLYDTLSALPIKRIECIALTHTDTDHINYLDHLINSYEIGKIIYPEFCDDESISELLEKAALLGIPIEKLSEDTELTFFDEVKFTALVDRAYITKIIDNTGALYVADIYGTTVAFTGDMEAPQEYAYLEYGDALDCDILVAAHHGSAHSSIIPILELYTPDYSVVSVGENSHGNPSDAALSRLRKFSDVLRTDELGNIVFKINEKGYRLVEK